jgi:hypothetical protein
MTTIISNPTTKQEECTVCMDIKECLILECHDTHIICLNCLCCLNTLKCPICRKKIDINTYIYTRNPHELYSYLYDESPPTITRTTITPYNTRSRSRTQSSSHSNNSHSSIDISSRRGGIRRNWYNVENNCYNVEYSLDDLN